MKLFLTIALFSLHSFYIFPASQQQADIISSFKDVPSDLMGCGSGYYLSEKDKKAGKTVFWTDYGDAVIHVNGKQILLKTDEKISNGQNADVYIGDGYTVIVKDGLRKQLDTEYFVMKATLTIKHGSKVIFSKVLIGDGGC
ncbi:MAG: hypothetical protein JSU01_08345 [Bacteroidetes bacterium]|nr:hypothetical protein [Bacteroidota bacterium]